MTFLNDRSGLFAFRNEYLENDQDSRHGETLFSFGPLHKKHEQNLSFFKKKSFLKLIQSKLYKPLLICLLNVSILNCMFLLLYVKKYIFYFVIFHICYQCTWICISHVPCFRLENKKIIYLSLNELAWI